MQGWQLQNISSPVLRKESQDIFEKPRRVYAEERLQHRAEMRKEFGGRGQTFASLLDEVKCDDGGGGGQAAADADRRREVAAHFFSDEEVQMPMNHDFSC